MRARHTPREQSRSVVLGVSAGEERVRAEPFDAIEPDAMRSGLVAGLLGNQAALLG
jgi:hypothetical protein